MYDRYSFVLNWSDLSEELQNQKIEEYLTKEFETDSKEMTLEEYLNDYDNLQRAMRVIEAHFPIYF